MSRARGVACRVATQESVHYVRAIGSWINMEVELGVSDVLPQQLRVVYMKFLRALSLGRWEGTDLHSDLHSNTV